jgi:NosR/NirI family nitrous oxide reductase transcriptional regulator
MMASKRQKNRTQRLERTLALIAVVILIMAWVLGTFRAEADLQPFLERIMPEADRFDPASVGTYAAWKTEPEKTLIGYVTTGKAHGYAGEITMAVAVALSGTIEGLAVVEHKETSSFFHRVLQSDLMRGLRGKSYADSFILGWDVDGVTGATYSARAMAEAVRKASRKIAEKNLGFPPIPEVSARMQFGFPEAILIALFTFGIAGRMRRFKHKKAARWVSMLVGLAVLGFLYNTPLTIAWINELLLGFWPQWQTHLYWYLLILGILFVYTIDNRNPYCEWFCPFGATQECLSVVGGGKLRVPIRAHTLLRWLQRTLALSAIVIALVYRNPGISSYEVFGAFFRLIGSNFLFILLGIVLVASLFIRRPWCSYLCPLRPVTDFIRLIRNWGRDLWIKK